jgi:hypothetical protein
LCLLNAAWRQGFPLARWRPAPWYAARAPPTARRWRHCSAAWGCTQG